jgi:hypothetical protein
MQFPMVTIRGLGLNSIAVLQHQGVDKVKTEARSNQLGHTNDVFSTKYFLHILSAFQTPPLAHLC